LQSSVAHATLQGAVLPPVPLAVDEQPEPLFKAQLLQVGTTRWLSYREHGMLDRSLSVEEVRYITGVARRIAAILLLSPALDASYNAVKGNAVDWKTLAKR
jgi:hypothetical protein